MFTELHMITEMLKNFPLDNIDEREEYFGSDTFVYYQNIAKGTTDPRVEFILPK